jgi:hypothetical protein
VVIQIVESEVCAPISWFLVVVLRRQMMKGKIFIVISMLVSLTMGFSFANAFDDDWMDLSNSA